MMKRKLSVICGLAVLAVGFGGTAFGGPITIDTDLLSNLVGGTPVAVTDLMISDVSDTVVQSEVYSRVYTLEGATNGPYVYLYQLDNTGILAEGAHSLERLTLAPFAKPEQELGYLSALDGTDGFLSDGEVPESTAYITDSVSPEISFSFRKWRGYQIDPGEHTKVLYAISEFSPYIDQQLVTINANVIDGLVATGTVIGPGTVAYWPEPNTFILLSMGLAFIFGRRIRR